MQIEASGSFSVHVCWTLCWWHDNVFVRGEEGSVSEKGVGRGVLTKAGGKLERVCFAGTLMKYSIILQEEIMLGRLCY